MTFDIFEMLNFLLVSFLTLINPHRNYKAFIEKEIRQAKKGSFIVDANEQNQKSSGDLASVVDRDSDDSMHELVSKQDFHAVVLRRSFDLAF